MFKKLSLSVAIVLFVCAGAFATILLPVPSNPLVGSIQQFQNFSILDTGGNAGLGSSILLNHGTSDASIYQGVSIYNEHNAPESQGPHISLFDFLSGGHNHDNCTVEASQVQDVDIDQIGSASGNCGVISVMAFLDAGGEQAQFIGNSVQTKVQAQTSGLEGDQVLLRSDGGGQGESKQFTDIDQYQFGQNAAGSIAESSLLDADQTAKVSGQPTSTANLMNHMKVTTSQGQVVY
jgi:hypothetical protein